MSPDFFEEQQRNKSQRKRAIERRKRERHNGEFSDNFGGSTKNKRRNRHEIRTVLKQWEFLEDESELLYDQ